MEDYAKRIVDEFNKWAKRYKEALEKDGAGGFIEESVAAFMCNAISLQAGHSSHKEVRDYFSANAIY